MPETEEAHVQSFVEETATHSSIFSGKFNGQKSLRPWALKELDMTKHAHTHTHTHTHTHLYVFFGEMSIEVFCPFFQLGSSSFVAVIELYELFVYFQN